VSLGWRRLEDPRPEKYEAPISDLDHRIHSKHAGWNEIRSKRLFYEHAKTPVIE